MEPDSGGCPNLLRPRLRQTIIFPPLRGPASPLCRVPPIARAFSIAPLCRDLLKPPITRGAAAPLCWTLAARGRCSGMAAPLAATAPPLMRRCAALAGAALPRLARTPAACLAGCGWNSLVRRLPDSLALRLGRCPQR